MELAISGLGLVLLSNNVSRTLGSLEKDQNLQSLISPDQMLDPRLMHLCPNCPHRRRHETGLVQLMLKAGVWIETDSVKNAVSNKNAAHHPGKNGTTTEKILPKLISRF